MKLKENSKLVYDFVKAHETENITSGDIAEGTGLTKKQVDGIVTMAFQRHKDEEKNEIPLMRRIPGEITLEDGTHKPVKYIVLTDEGRAIEIDAE